AQIGTVEEEEKPDFAGLRPGQSLETITLAEALELFKLPRELGTTVEGETVWASIGRFGPYIRYDSKFVSLKEDDPHTIELPRALELIALKKQADLDRILKTFESSNIQILKGRWGPFISDGAKNARIAKDRDFETLTLAECQEALAAAPDKKDPGKKSRKKVAGKNEADKATPKFAKKKVAKKKAPKKKTSKKARRKKNSSKKAGSKKTAEAVVADAV
ncbi:MAG: topoisomerase C-terminal repeat-containing protein, partial [Burkholderiales bacterium]